jgi:hypothetical protein
VAVAFKYHAVPCKTELRRVGAGERDAKRWRDGEMEKRRGGERRWRDGEGGENFRAENA